MATVIKASGPLRPGDGATFNFDDMGVRANSYLDTMRAQAAAILAKAEQDAEVIRRRAEAEGQQAAIRACEKVMEEKVGKQLATLLPAIQQVATQLAQAKDAWLLHWEKAAVQLAVRVAERMVRSELKQRPEIPTALIRESLELAAGRGDVLVYLHPNDVDTLGTHAEALARELVRQGTAKVVADPTVSAGGCRVETRFGVIDQTFEAQLKRIEEELT